MGINGSRRQNNHIKKNLRWTDLGGGIYTDIPPVATPLPTATTRSSQCGWRPRLSLGRQPIRTVRTFAGTQYTYPRRDGQAELSAGYIPGWSPISVLTEPDVEQRVTTEA